MDYSGIISFVMAATIASIFIIGARRLKRSFHPWIPFGLTFVIIMMLIRPWEWLYPTEWREGILIVLIIAAWIAAGSFVGDAIAKRLIR